MSTPREDAARVRRASRGVFICFALSGFNFASWAARLPAVQGGLGLRKDQMGLLLLTGAVASVAALPLSGLVVERIGTRATVTAAAALNAAGLATAGVCAGVGSLAGTVAGLVVYGVGTSMWDAAMNIEGAAVEQRLGRTVMPRYHAGFSLGTVVASALSAAVAAAHVPLGIHLPIALAASFVALLWSVSAFLPRGIRAGAGAAGAAADVAGIPAARDAVMPGEAPAAHRGARGALAAWTDARTLLIGLVVFAAALTEGSANDWLSLSVVDGWRLPDAVGALGLWLFVAAMTGMRWFATAALDRFGRVWVLRLCAMLSIAGLLVFGLAGSLPVALAGALVWGAGAAVGFPVGMSAASDDPRHAAQRVAVVATIGYAAFLAGPPVLGLLAQHLGYRHALLAVCVPVLVGLFAVRAAAPLRRGEPGSGPGPAAPPTLGA